MKKPLYTIAVVITILLLEDYLIFFIGNQKNDCILQPLITK